MNEKGHSRNGALQFTTLVRAHGYLSETWGIQIGYIMKMSHAYNMGLRNIVKLDSSIPAFYDSASKFTCTAPDMQSTPAWSTRIYPVEEGDQINLHFYYFTSNSDSALNIMIIHSSKNSYRTLAFFCVLCGTYR